MTAHVIPDPPLHNLLMPHDTRYDQWDARGCPPNCLYRKWAEQYLPPRDDSRCKA